MGLGLNEGLGVFGERRHERTSVNDKQLIRCARQFRHGIIGVGGDSFMKCFMVSAPLAGLLEAHGVPAKLVEGSFGYCNHYWIELADGRVLDPTADQFNHYPHADAPLPDVYLGKRRAIHKTPNVRAEAGPTAKRQARVVENAPAHCAGLAF